MICKSMFSVPVQLKLQFKIIRSMLSGLRIGLDSDYKNFTHSKKFTVRMWASNPRESKENVACFSLSHLTSLDSFNFKK